MEAAEHSEVLAGDSESVTEFYAGKSVFITGGTGFLGKVFIEKLLYSCPDIGNLYILIRDKKGVTVEERIQQLLNKPLFSRIRSERPEDLKKIVPIIGDITQPGLGITSEDGNKLIEEVSVVFHVAATIKFNEKLHVAVQANIKGTEYVLNLCHRIKNIKAFVHVSTAYSNPEQKVIYEKVYPPRAKLTEVMNYIEQPCQDEQYIKEHFLKDLPNTYTFTKSLAENYVAEHRGNIPTVIIRPSIVSPSLREPLPGWTDNWFGATGLLVASVKGANRVLYGEPTNVLDVIPVDYVSNVTIVAAAKCSKSSALVVYHSSTSSCNPIQIQTIFNNFKNYAIRIGFHDNSYPTLMFTKSKCLLHTMTFLLQTIPAYIADLATWATGKQPKMVKLQSRLIFGREMLNYFTSNSWEIRSDNVKSLHTSLSQSEQAIFPCDPSDMNWEAYMTTYVNGIKSYLMN